MLLTAHLLPCPATSKKMGLGPSRLTYQMPPPPTLSEEDLDLSLEGTHLQDRIVDQEGYYMCRRVAIREGVLAASVAMAVTGLTILLTKRKAGTLHDLLQSIFHPIP